MSKRQLSALLGFWVIIFLFLGIPIGWDRWIAIVTGVLIILVAYKKVPKKNPVSNGAFVQSDSVQTRTQSRPQAAPVQTQAKATIAESESELESENESDDSSESIAK